MKKTSHDWAKEILPPMKIIITDYDGWDRKNFNYSWNEELITKEEFKTRVLYSISIKIKS